MQDNDFGRGVVIAARTWIGTPYVHQAHCKGAGTDCLGLIRGVWRQVVGAEPEQVPPYTADWAESDRDEPLLAAARAWLIPKGLCDAASGDVLVFRMRSGFVAKHLGIQANGGTGPSFIHAYSGHCVMESPLTAPWTRRIVARFAFPQGEN
jgi:NlpC/P60 family putative phage cell wall peptidase